MRTRCGGPQPRSWRPAAGPSSPSTGSPARRSVPPGSAAPPRTPRPRPDARPGSSLLPRGPMASLPATGMALPVIALRTGGGWQVRLLIPQTGIGAVKAGRTVTISVPAAQLSGVIGYDHGSLPHAGGQLGGCRLRSRGAGPRPDPRHPAHWHDRQRPAALRSHDRLPARPADGGGGPRSVRSGRAHRDDLRARQLLGVRTAPRSRVLARSGAVRRLHPGRPGPRQGARPGC